MTLLSPSNNLSPVLQQEKKNVFSSGNSARRASTSSVTVAAIPQTQIPQGIGYSPNSSQNTTASPAGSGIPSFRTLRSLLPFGSGKNATLTSTSTPPSSSKSPFSGFGSVRRSMAKERERKISLSNDATPVISISRSTDDPVADETAIRRSVSLSRLEKPLPLHPNFDADSSDADTGYVLRTPSPLPTLSADLSTIIEADSSGVSRHSPFVTSESTSAQSHTSPPILQRNLLHVEHPSASRESSFSRSLGASYIRDGPSSVPRVSTFSRSVGASYIQPTESEADTSVLELPTDELAEQVREAMRKSGSSTTSGKQWFSADKDPIIIDGDEHPEVADRSFSVDTVEPDLLALLSPNSKSRNGSSHSLSRQGEQAHYSYSPSTPTFPSSPAPLLPRQTSSLLPRLRPPHSPSLSSTTPQFPIPQPSPTGTSPSGTTTPKASPLKPRTPVSPMIDEFTPDSPSSGLPLSATSTPAKRTQAARRVESVPSSSSSTSNARSRATNVFSGLLRSSDTQTPNTSSHSRPIPRMLRQVVLGSNDRPRTANARLDSTSPPSPTRIGRGSLDSRRPPTSNPAMKDVGLGRPSLDIPRRSTLEPRTRTQISRSSASPEPTTYTNGTPTDIDSSPSPEAPFQTPVSFDSGRPSFETSNRPGSVARLRERDRDTQRTPSLRVTGATGERVSSISRNAGPSRVRKRSMSVQERFPLTSKGRFASSAEYGSVAGISRPGSSMSVHAARSARAGAFGLDSEDGEGGSGPGPKMEWIGPRTAKAFRAAGLLDFERSREKDKDSDGSDTTERLLRNRSRSGSVGGVPSPSPLGSGSGGGNGQGRFTAMRSASEYNPTHGRPHSRMAFSEAGGTTSTASRRRGSGSFSAYGSVGAAAAGPAGTSPYGYAGLMDSPTFTVSSSSRERDGTPKSSTSTAPTSLSESLGYFGRDRAERDRDREELRELKDRHATEMAALLSALSDSQRTARMLREENAELRERFDRFSGVIRENEELRRTCNALESECIGLRGKYADCQRELAATRSQKPSNGLMPSWSSSSVGSGLRTPIAKGNSSPLSMDMTPQFLRQQGDQQEIEEEIYNNTIIIHDSFDNDDENEGTPQYDTHGQTMDDNDSGVLDAVKPSSSLTPSHQRRLSNTSSIFPTVPANMTMLLHEDSTSNMGLAGADNSQFHFTFPASPNSAFHSKPLAKSPQSKSHTPSLSKSPPLNFRNFAGPGHHANKSITSNASISPTTANFSMVTGSPGSLNLRPEHEILLGDMESLDLGIRDTDAEGGESHKMGDNDSW